jgi:hypothetical protein
VEPEELRPAQVPQAAGGRLVQQRPVAPAASAGAQALESREQPARPTSARQAWAASLEWRGAAA